jgi:hypothetical protein
MIQDVTVDLQVGVVVVQTYLITIATSEQAIIVGTTDTHVDNAGTRVEPIV